MKITYAFFLQLISGINMQLNPQQFQHKTLKYKINNLELSSAIEL